MSTNKYPYVVKNFLDGAMPTNAHTCLHALHTAELAELIRITGELPAVSKADMHPGVSEIEKSL